MTAALTETVSGRTILRYRGEPVTHDIRFTPATPPDPGYRLGGTVAQPVRVPHHPRRRPRRRQAGRLRPLAQDRRALDAVLPGAVTATPGEGKRTTDLTGGSAHDHRMTNDARSGGFMFSSYAYGPCCAERQFASIESYSEEHFIRGWCPEGVSFAGWIRGIRGPNAAITIIEGRRP